MAAAGGGDATGGRRTTVGLGGGGGGAIQIAARLSIAIAGEISPLARRRHLDNPEVTRYSTTVTMPVRGVFTYGVASGAHSRIVSS